jgi:hypothetical protein
MTRKRRTSSILNKAMVRIAGMRTIDETLELSDGLSLAEYDVHFKALQDELLNYNTVLASIDVLAEQVKQREATLSAYSERMMMGLTLRYGRGSFEYLQVGGKIRKSPGKRSKPATTPAATPVTTSAAITPADIAALMNGTAIAMPMGNAVTASMN